MSGMFSEDTLDVFNEHIRKIVRDEMQKILSKRNIEEYKNVKVLSREVASDSNTVISATVIDMATGETIKNVPNESGKFLEDGDIVRLYETGGNYHSRYIGLNFGKE